jgi:hypothetical protein
LQECADEVLPGGQIHAGLPADAAIDHRQQCRGDLDEWHAAQIGRGDEPGEVADDPAAEGDDRSRRSARSLASQA